MSDEIVRGARHHRLEFVHGVLQLSFVEQERGLQAQGVIIFWIGREDCVVHLLSVFLLALSHQNFDDQLLVERLPVGFGLDSIFVLAYCLGPIAQTKVKSAHLLKRLRVLLGVRFKSFQNTHYLVAALAHVVVLGQVDLQLEFLRIVLDRFFEYHFGLVRMILEHVQPIQLQIALKIGLFPFYQGLI